MQPNDKSNTHLPAHSSSSYVFKTNTETECVFHKLKFSIFFFLFLSIFLKNNSRNSFPLMFDVAIFACSPKHGILTFFGSLERLPKGGGFGYRVRATGVPVLPVPLGIDFHTLLPSAKTIGREKTK